MGSLWIVAIKLHTREEFLHFGSAGPALMAVILSYRGKAASVNRPWMRLLVFFLVACGLLVGLSLHYAWRSDPNLNITLSPWLVIPAIPSAWIVSASVSKDSGIRGLARRFAHFPNRWSLVALLIFPIVILLPALGAYLLHLPLVWPERSGSPASLFAASVLLFLYSLLFPALLEEPGWRGFLLDHLQAGWSPLKASMVVWVAWALWHAPLDYFRPEDFLWRCS